MSDVISSNSPKMCSVCPFEGGCGSVYEVWHSKWVMNNDMAEKNKAPYMQAMSRAGISVTATSVCIRGLAEKDPAADSVLLAERVYVLHHESLSAVIKEGDEA